MKVNLRSFKQKVRHNGKQLKSFLTKTSKHNSKAWEANAEEMNKEVWQEVDCLSCANCCKTTPAVLLSSDIKRIAKFLKISPKLFVRKYVLEDINGELSFRKVPCVFLEADNKCAVYAVRPVACKDYPHTESSGFLRRRKLHKANVKICPASYFILKRMDK